MKESQKKALIQVLLCIRNTAVGLLGIIGWLLHTLLAVLTVGLLSAALVCILIYAKVKPQLDECRELAYDKLAQMEQELADLRKGKTVADYKAKFVSQGYDEALAEDTAKALADGDSAKVFANQSKFLEEYAKKVKADAIKKTPKPGAGSGSGTEGAVDYGKKIEEAQKNGDFTAVAYYTRLKAQAEAEAQANNQ